MAGFNFNANQVDGDVRDFSPIPKGKYPAVIIATELGQANEKGTEQLKVDWEITEGPCEKRRVSNWITVACPTSNEAQDIGMRFLKNICESVGIAGFTDTDELCGRAHVIDVGDRKDRTDPTKVYNEVKRCYAAGTPTAPATTPTASKTTPTAQASTATPAAKPASTATVGKPAWMTTKK